MPPMLLAFDMPQPLATMGRRSVSNVPAQALILMNDPFVQEQAKLWAKKVVARGGTAEERVRAMYEEAYGRAPSAEESAAVVGFVGQLKEEGRDEAGAWAEVAHVLVNAKEFVFVE